ncbi:MAG: lipoprotein [Nitrosomonadaceae bacterium]
MLFLALFLDACGLKGPLYLPQDTPKKANTKVQKN